MVGLLALAAGCGDTRGKVLEVKVYDEPSDVKGPSYWYTMSQSANDRTTTQFSSRKKHAVGDVFCFNRDLWGEGSEAPCPLGLKPWPQPACTP